MLKALYVFLLHLSICRAFDPGCSFSGNQCVYNVKLGHEGACDSPGSAPGGSQSCCTDVQSTINTLRGTVEDLTNQMKAVQSELGMKQTSSAHNNSLANERDQLLRELQLKQAELDQVNDNNRELKEEVANKTRDLNNCRGVLGVKNGNNIAPVTVTSDYSMKLCTFENSSFCGYTQDKTENGDWYLASGSLSKETGPREDHTLGSPKGMYIYINPTQRASIYRGNTTMRLISPVYQPAHAYCLRFWYNMYGKDMRTLKVYAKIGGQGLGYPIWSSSVNQGQTWHLAEVSLNSEYTSRQFQIVFEGWTNAYRVTGYYSGDHYVDHLDNMAVDDVYLYNTSCSKVPRCPPGAVTHKGSNSSSTSCYTFHTTPLNWYQSAEACSQEGAFSHLVSVNSQDEQTFLVNTIKQSADLMAAGSYGWYTSGNDERQESTFDWTDTGTPYTGKYTDWYPGQPNNVAGDQDCLLLQYADSNYQWGDIDCDEAHPYICEAEMPVV